MPSPGIESRGFLFGMPLAMSLGVPFITVRKKGKLPWKTVSYKYDLEYGSASHRDACGSV
jgi:adenine phosphoribosyltransferase